MNKQTYRARRVFEPTAGDKRAALALNAVVELSDAEAEAYGDVVVLVRPRVVKQGRYRQYDDAGQTREFGPGDTILLSDADVEAFGEEKFAPVAKHAPAPPAPAAASDEGAAKP